MHQHGQRGNRTQAHVGHEGRGNQNTVAKAMHAIAREHGPTARFGWGVMRDLMGIVMVVVVVMMMFMSVMPQLGFVQQKEKHQAKQQRHEQAFGPRLALKRLGQQMQERGAHQRTRSQAEHVLRVAGQHAKTKQRG